VNAPRRRRSDAFDVVTLTTLARGLTPQTIVKLSQTLTADETRRLLVRIADAGEIGHMDDEELLVLVGLGLLAFWSFTDRDTTTTAPAGLPLAAPAVDVVGPGDATPSLTIPVFTEPSFRAPDSVPPISAQAPTTSRQDGDAVPMGAITVIGGCPDVRGWPVTTRISRIVITPGNTWIEFDKRDGPGGWPGTQSTWSSPGDLTEYTVWLVRSVGGAWYTSGFVQMWPGRDGLGDTSPGRYHINWFYDAGRWGPMLAGGPIASGETIGFFVTQGDERAGVSPAWTLAERSNVVTLPATDNGSFDFPA
jgi:hypothetical protein